MLADSRSSEFFRNFVGQWLQSRDIDSVIINAPAVISRDEPPDPDAERRRNRFRELARKPADQLTAAEKKELQDARAAFPRNFRRFREFELTGELRTAMRRETEMLVEHIVRDNRSLLEVLDGHYTFLNERLAKHYGIEGITGDRMRKVDLPPGSPRGGILTQATVLSVTSNPDRTSPVKRGLYILRQHPRLARQRYAAEHPVARRGRQESIGQAAHVARSQWFCIAPSPPVPRAMPGWTRSAWPWRISTPWDVSAENERTVQVDASGKPDQRRIIQERSGTQAYSRRAARS